MSNSIIIYILIAFVIILICSLFFLFKKKNKNITSSDSSNVEYEKESNANDIDIVKDFEKTVEKVEVDMSQQNDKKSTLIVNEQAKTEVLFGNESKNVSKLSISISSKTEKALLNKLKEFEDSKAFIKKDVNLSYLAKNFDTNTKYLSEIIKTYKNKNFNHYLNELRINYLINELNNNEKVLNTKVSYLASDFGFSSHSSFSTIFTQYIGQTPSEYIKNLKKEKASSIIQ